MLLPSGHLYHVFLMDTTEVVPDKNDITVQGNCRKVRQNTRLKEGWQWLVCRRI
jgi:hypothetical protein